MEKYIEKDAFEKLDLDSLAERMLRAYSLDCGINKRGESGVPSKKEIEAIIKYLFIVLKHPPVI